MKCTLQLIDFPFPAVIPGHVRLCLILCLNRKFIKLLWTEPRLWTGTRSDDTCSTLRTVSVLPMLLKTFQNHESEMWLAQKKIKNCFAWTAVRLPLPHLHTLSAGPQSADLWGIALLLWSQFLEKILHI